MQERRCRRGQKAPEGIAAMHEQPWNESSEKRRVRVNKRRDKNQGLLKENALSSEG